MEPSMKLGEQTNGRVRPEKTRVYETIVGAQQALTRARGHALEAHDFEGLELVVAYLQRASMLVDEAARRCGDLRSIYGRAR
jgi:hypothetical protein